MQSLDDDMSLLVLTAALRRQNVLHIGRGFVTGGVCAELVARGYVISKVDRVGEKAGSETGSEASLRIERRPLESKGKDAWPVCCRG
jgi:hypothetical protein